MRIFLILSLMLFSSFSYALSMKFRGQMTIWDCPLNARYVLLECLSEEKEPENFHLEMVEISPNFFAGQWNAVMGEPVTAFGKLFVSYDPQSEFKLSVLSSVGWNEDYHLNTGYFFQQYDTRFPGFHMTGSRLPQENGRELVVTMSVDNFSIEAK